MIDVALLSVIRRWHLREGGKSDRRRRILRDLERTARQLPSRKYENVAQDLLAIVNALDWNEWRAVKVKSKLARLINPRLAEDVKDEHALNDDDWRRE